MEIRSLIRSWPMTSVLRCELYVRAVGPEYWVFDISGRRLLVHRKLVNLRWPFVVVAVCSPRCIAAHRCGFTAYLQIRRPYRAIDLLSKQEELI